MSVKVRWAGFNPGDSERIPLRVLGARPVCRELPGGIMIEMTQDEAWGEPCVVLRVAGAGDAPIPAAEGAPSDDHGVGGSRGAGDVRSGQERARRPEIGTDPYADKVADARRALYLACKAYVAEIEDKGLRAEEHRVAVLEAADGLSRLMYLDPAPIGPRATVKVPAETNPRRGLPSLSGKSEVFLAPLEDLQHGPLTFTSSDGRTRVSVILTVPGEEPPNVVAIRVARVGDPAESSSTKREADKGVGESLFPVGTGRTSFEPQGPQTHAGSAVDINDPQGAETTMSVMTSVTAPDNNDKHDAATWRRELFQWQDRRTGTHWRVIEAGKHGQEAVRTEVQRLESRRWVWVDVPAEVAWRLAEGGAK